MESGGADTPVTLVIKASDQKHEDCTINCFMSWTVEELKSHIATVYPSKPRSRDQRLVYSGKLLQDHLQLRDVLRQPHDEYAILHLMCSSCTPPGSPAPHSASTLNAGSSESARSAHRDGASISGGPDDLRRRGAIVSLNPLSPAGVPRLPQGGAQTPLRGDQMLMPIQMLWWQQMYARHYYMQYQAAAAAASQTPSFPPATSQPPPSRPNEAAPPPLAPPAVPDADPLPENLALPPAANANIQINVQGGGGGGGGALNEDELNRDWLDWLYALFRGCVLLSFVYFHCSFSHFIMVVGAMMLVYLHQVGWFPFRTVAHQQQQQQQELPNFQDPEQAQAWEEAEMQRGIWELERVMDNGMDEAQQEDPGLLATACSFVRIFFTSLIPEGWPQRPPALPPVLRPH